MIRGMKRRRMKRRRRRMITMRKGRRRTRRYLVWSVQRILQPCLGMTRPRCILSLQLVGPV